MIKWEQIREPKGIDCIFVHTNFQLLQLLPFVAGVWHEEGQDTADDAPEGGEDQDRNPGSRHPR